MFDDNLFTEKVSAITDGRFLFPDGSTMYAIVGASEGFDAPQGQPCALKVYKDPRSWKYNVLCRFPAEDGDALFIAETKKMGTRLLPGEEIVWSSWSDSKIHTVRSA